MNVISIVNSVLGSLTYLVPIGSNKECWLVDCGDIEQLMDLGWKIKGVLLTHAHFDHIYGLNRLLDQCPNAVVITNKAGREALLNPRLNLSRYYDYIDDFVFALPRNVMLLECDGYLYFEKGVEIECFFTYGHSPSCISYKIGNHLFTGDAYIPGHQVCTSLPGSDKEAAKDSMQRLMEMEKNGCTIHCGHQL